AASLAETPVGSTNSSARALGAKVLIADFIITASLFLGEMCVMSHGYKADFVPSTTVRRISS
ncbi:hypothetical protein, partial [Pseudomonas sp. FW305-113]|uniref:hypothetical protein n=1 Tax=Pseudomonas sp. FW305-113 TaxID=2751322 RepID=UPI001A920964